LAAALTREYSPESRFLIIDGNYIYTFYHFHNSGKAQSIQNSLCQALLIWLCFHFLKHFVPMDASFLTQFQHFVVLGTLVENQPKHLIVYLVYLLSLSHCGKAQKESFTTLYYF
jgi:hypothetical protein